MDLPATVTPRQYSLRADARGYAIDILCPDGPAPFARTSGGVNNRADPQTNAQRGQLTAALLGCPLADTQVGKDLGTEVGWP